MKILPKLERKLRRLKKRVIRTSLVRKLDLVHESARKKAFQESCDNYKNQIENEYEIRNKLPKMARSGREAFLSDGSFHQAVGRVLLVAEFFAMMPVKGVTGKHPSGLSFSWRNIRTCFSLLFIASSIANFGLSLFKVLHNPISFNSIKPIIFRGSVLLVLIVSLNLARQWPQLMMYWHTVEKDLPQYKTQLSKWKMGHTISMVMLLGMMLSFAEHILSMVSAINYASFCNRTADPIQNYFLRTNDEIFFVTSYTTALALWGKFQNVYSTFIWNYMDMFVMIVSIGLASKFRQLNDDLRNFKGMNMAPTYWSERRIQYRNICILCDKMDDAISLITMVSFSNNLYFICVQLLRSLNTMPSVAHAVYFYFSLFFLIGRTLAVSLYSSSVHDESRLTLRYLRCVPKESWCQEVKRFTEEVISDEVTLSGMKFFHLTRKLVLSVRLGCWNYRNLRTGSHPIPRGQRPVGLSAAWRRIASPFPEWPPSPRPHACPVPPGTLRRPASAKTLCSQKAAPSILAILSRMWGAPNTCASGFCAVDDQAADNTV